MKLLLDSADETLFDHLQTKTRLDRLSVLNEALTVYTIAVEAREDDKEIAIIDEDEGTYRLLVQPGLSNVEPRQRSDKKRTIV